MSTYNCQKCNITFKKKVELRDHIKEDVCLEDDEIVTVDIKSGTSRELQSLFKSCLSILRNDGSHLVGDEALKEMSYFLILKQIEKHIVDGSVDIFNLKYYDQRTIKRYTEDKFLKQLEFVKFSKLTEYSLKEEELPNLKNVFNNFIWKDVLSKHPKFREIFEEGKILESKDTLTIKKLLVLLNSVDFEKYEHDVLGEAYESVFVDAVFGAGGNKKSELGQFFTPLKVKKLLVELVDPKIKNNGEIESVFDPACGTGGILNTVIKHYKKLLLTDTISYKELKDQLVKNIYGIEIKNKIYNLCMSNMLINTGEIIPGVMRGDSIRNFHDIKVDIITANPPFSVTINYDELEKNLDGVEVLNNYIPIKVGGKNSELLFLQIMIYCLKIEGRCSTVMLDGSKMYGTASGYSKVREYLMKSCDLKEVIYCPGGTFTSTASKTCILFFVKKKEREDVVEIKGVKRVLKFCGEHATTCVKFYNFNPETEEKNFIREVDIEDIASKNYSLNEKEYKEKEKGKIYNSDIKIKKISEVCTFLPKSKRQASYGNEEGEYPFFKSSMIVKSFVDEPDYTEESIIIGDGGEPNINYNEQFSTSDHCYILRSKEKEIFLLKYIYYYILVNINIMDELYVGACIKNISKEKISNINIPIPPLECQVKIVDFLDKLFNDKNDLQKVTAYYKGYDTFKYLSKLDFEYVEDLVKWQVRSIMMDNEIQTLKEDQSIYIRLMTKNVEEIKTLGDVSAMNVKGDTNTSSMTNTGEYPFYKASVVNPSGTHDRYCFENKNQPYILFVKSGGNAQNPLSLTSGIGKVYLVKEKSAGNTEVVQIINSHMVNLHYLFYYLRENQLNIQKLANYTLNLGHISMIKFKDFEIPIPSKEKQEKIVKYCDHIEEKIKEIEMEIEKHKELINHFLE